MAKSYPDPHPYEVAGFKDSLAWGKAGRPVPEFLQYEEWHQAHGEARGVAAGQYGLWRQLVDATMASHAKRKAEPAVQAPAPARAEGIPAAPSNAVPMLRHLQAKRQKPRLEPMNVRIPESTLAALDRYVRHHRVAKQDVVADMLAHMLTISGFAPAAD